jgi:hypothetical protein
MFENIYTCSVHLCFALHVGEGVAMRGEQHLFNCFLIVTTMATLAVQHLACFSTCGMHALAPLAAAHVEAEMVTDQAKKLHFLRKKLLMYVITLYV